MTHIYIFYFSVICACCRFYHFGLFDILVEFYSQTRFIELLECTKVSILREKAILKVSFVRNILKRVRLHTMLVSRVQPQNIIFSFQYPYIRWLKMKTNSEWELWRSLSSLSSKNFWRAWFFTWCWCWCYPFRDRLTCTKHYGL